MNAVLKVGYTRDFVDIGLGTLEDICLGAFCGVAIRKSHSLLVKIWLLWLVSSGYCVQMLLLLDVQ